MSTVYTTRVVFASTSRSSQRAAIRKRKLREIEKEVSKEEAAGLIMTEEQRQVLDRSFSAVKTEFADLDGLRWSRSRLGRREHSKNYDPPPPSSCRPPSPLELDDASFECPWDLSSSEDTIRVSQLPQRIYSPLKDAFAFENVGSDCNETRTGNSQDGSVLVESASDNRGQDASTFYYGWNTTSEPKSTLRRPPSSKGRWDISTSGVLRCIAPAV